MNIVKFICEGADYDLWPVALWIVAGHQLLKDRFVFIVITTESLDKAPQTALHSHSQGGIL